MQRVRTFSAALILTLSSISTFGAGIVHAAGNTCTWTGSGGNTNFSTASNWSGCAGGAPTDGDDLIFNALSTDKIATNDIADLSVGTVTFTDTSNTNRKFTIDGTQALTVTTSIVASDNPNAFTAPLKLGGNISVTELAGSILDIEALDLNGYNLTVQTSLYVNGIVSGSGDITIDNGFMAMDTATNTWQGTLHIGTGSAVYAYPGTLGSASNSIIVDQSGYIALCRPNGATLNQSFTLASESTLGTPALVAASSCGGGSAGTTSDPQANLTLAGTITLTNDVKVNAAGILTITGPLVGAHTIQLAAGNVGSLVINSSNNQSGTPNGDQASADVVTTYSDNDAAQDIFVDPKNIVIVTGVRGDVTVNGGTLKGTGTVGNITVTAGSVAPGMSPGILNTGNLDFQGGTYQAELGGTTAGAGYDQLKVTGTVSLAGSALQISHYNSFRPAQGNAFTIIDNDGTDAVTGTFTGLAEGATTTVDGIVYSITYKGGDGNDVVLTAVTVPATPKTGFTMITANPLVTMAVTLAAAGGLLLVARAQKRPAAKRR